MLRKTLAAVWAFTDICEEIAVPYRINPVIFPAFVQTKVRDKLDSRIRQDAT